MTKIMDCFCSKSSGSNTSSQYEFYKTTDKNLDPTSSQLGPSISFKKKDKSHKKSKSKSSLGVSKDGSRGQLGKASQEEIIGSSEAAGVKKGERESGVKVSEQPPGAKNTAQDDKALKVSNIVTRIG